MSQADKYLTHMAMTDPIKVRDSVRVLLKRSCLSPKEWREWRELVMNSLYKLICQAPRPFGGTTVVGVILLQPIFLEYAKI